MMTAGLLLFVAGAAVYFFHDKLNWFGHLPGDIRIEKENSRFYFPVTSMILLSVTINLLIILVRKLFG